MDRRIPPFINILISIVLLATFSACQDSTDEDQRLLKALNMIERSPDSAFLYLDSIKAPEKMDKASYANYYITLVQAKHKTYRDISKDTIIFDAVKYTDTYSENEAEKARANLYAACVLIENEDYTEALQYLLKANSFVKSTENNKLNALIKSQMGNTFYSENLQDSAISYYKQALNIYSTIKGEEHNLMGAIYKTAISFAIKQKYDSALYYNEKGLNIAEHLNDKVFKKVFLSNLGINYRENKMPKKAKNTLLSALKIDNKDNTHIYLSLSKAYNDLDKTDSALYYAKMAKSTLNEQIDIYTSLSINGHIADLYEKSGDYKNALRSFKVYNQFQQNIKNNMRSDNLLEVEKKYNLAEKEKELVKSKLNQQILLSVSLATILLLGAAAFFIVVMRNKHKQASQRNVLLHKQIESTLFVNNLYKYITDESTSFEKQVDTLSHNYSIKEKSSGYETIQNMLKSMKKQTQENLYESSLRFLQEQLINSKVLDVLKSNTSDLLLISLTVCRYDFKNIATLLGVSTNALHMRRQRLKEKLKNAGISDIEIAKILK